MRRWLPGRLLAAVPTFLGITAVAFAIVRAAPGEAVPGDAMLRPGTLQQLREYRSLMGLDQPFLPGYLRWLSNLLHGGLGDSLRDGRPVLTLLAEALPVTLLLSGTALVLGYLLAIPIGVLSAVCAGKPLDRAFSWTAFLLYSLPVQWVAILLVVGASGSRIPIHGHFLLPVICLTYGTVAVVSRYLRSSMLEELGQDYVRTARSKGLPEAAVVLRHVLPNASLSLITLMGLTLPALASGAVIVEQIFGLPGMGKLTFDAVMGRDVPVLMGAVTLGGVLAMLGMVASDLLHAAVDPRIRISGVQR